jgi:hypothetical protein
MPVTAPVCHPERRHAGRGLCGKCYQDARKQGMGLFRDRPAPEPLAEPVSGLLALPEVCPRCGNACLRHYAGATEVNCFCGWEGHLRHPKRDAA